MARHGSRSKYVNEKCRCGKCRKANREYARYLKAKWQLNGKKPKR